MTEAEKAQLREFVYTSWGYLLTDAQLAEMCPLPEDPVWAQYIDDDRTPRICYIDRSKAEDFLRRKCPNGWLLPSPLKNIWRPL